MEEASEEQDWRADRRKARADILAAANAHQRRLGFRSKPLTMRHIQRAVCVVRRNRLVKFGVLIMAGFNSTEAR